MTRLYTAPIILLFAMLLPIILPAQELKTYKTDIWWGHEAATRRLLLRELERKNVADDLSGASIATEETETGAKLIAVNTPENCSTTMILSSVRSAATTGKSRARHWFP